MHPTAHYRIQFKPSANGDWMYCFYPVMGDPYSYLALAHLYGGEAGIVGIADPGVALDGADTNRNFDATLDALQVCLEQDGPPKRLCLAGFSFGALTAIGLARRLIAVRELRVVLMDPPFLLSAGSIEGPSRLSCSDPDPVAVLRRLLLRMHEAGAFQLADVVAIEQGSPMAVPKDAAAWIHELRRGLWLRSGTGSGDLEKFVCQFNSRIAITRAFKLSPITKPVMLVMSNDCVQPSGDVLDMLSALMRVTKANASHFSLLSRPAVAGYIEELRTFLEEPIPERCRCDTTIA